MSNSLITWTLICKLNDQMGISLITLNKQLQNNVISHLIQLAHVNFQQEMQRRWIFHCLSKEAHWVNVLISTTNKMAKAIVLNPTRMYPQDKLDDRISLIGKALIQVIWQVDAMGTYCHVQNMTNGTPETQAQVWLPP
eukprot:15323878-Ditylum_brightwellii.AAC.2